MACAIHCNPAITSLTHSEMHHLDRLRCTLHTKHPLARIQQTDSKENTSENVGSLNVAKGVTFHTLVLFECFRCVLHDFVKGREGFFRRCKKIYFFKHRKVTAAFGPWHSTWQQQQQKTLRQNKLKYMCRLPKHTHSQARWTRLPCRNSVKITT